MWSIKLSLSELSFFSIFLFLRLSLVTTYLYYKSLLPRHMCQCTKSKHTEESFFAGTATKRCNENGTWQFPADYSVCISQLREKVKRDKLQQVSDSWLMHRHLFTCHQILFQLPDSLSNSVSDGLQQLNCYSCMFRLFSFLSLINLHIFYFSNKTWL